MGHLRFLQKFKTKVLPPLVIKFNRFLAKRDHKTEILKKSGPWAGPFSFLGIFGHFGPFWLFLAKTAKITIPPLVIFQKYENLDFWPKITIFDQKSLFLAKNRDVLAKNRGF